MRAAALWLAAALVRQESHFLRRGFDPHCREGIADTTLSFCCQKNCGECSNGSPVCDGKEKNGRGSTCCPEDMGEQPTCEASFAPCQIPSFVRATTAAADLKTQTGDRTAIHDCDKALPDESARHLLATHFVKFERTAHSNGRERSCSTRTWEQASAKCDQEDWCVGMTADDSGDFACFLVAQSSVTELDIATGSTYLKSRGSAGQSYHYQRSAYVPDAACLDFCKSKSTDNSDDGDVPTDSNMTRTVECKSSQGMTMSLGMCSLEVAMNKDAYPTTEIACSCKTAIPYIFANNLLGDEVDAVGECVFNATDNSDREAMADCRKQLDGFVGCNGFGATYHYDFGENCTLTESTEDHTGHSLSSRTGKVFLDEHCVGHFQYEVEADDGSTQAYEYPIAIKDGVVTLRDMWTLAPVHSYVDCPA